MVTLERGESVAGMTQFTFLEFFAGGGMARAGLGRKRKAHVAPPVPQDQQRKVEVVYGRPKNANAHGRVQAGEHNSFRAHA